MSAITLVNATTPTQDLTAEFRLDQGGASVARIGVHAGGQATIPSTTSYMVQASTNIGLMKLVSNPVNLNTRSANVLAQVLVENGYYDFQLTLLPGTQPSAIQCENTWIKPVEFTVTMVGSPARIVNVVNEHNAKFVSTRKQWSCYAIVNGITTASVTTTNPDATITLVADNNDDAFHLVVS